MWLNLIRIMVTMVTANDTLIYQDHYMILHNYNRDIDLEIALEAKVVMSGIDPTTWGFMIYQEGDDKKKTSFEDPMMRVLVEGILPLAGHYFQCYFSPRGPAHQAYCQLFLGFWKGTTEQVH